MMSAKLFRVTLLTSIRWLELCLPTILTKTNHHIFLQKLLKYWLRPTVKASVGNPWELKIEANNVATTYTAYDLPSWLQVDGQYLKGTPDAEGSF